MRFNHTCCVWTAVDCICARVSYDDLFIIVDFGQVWIECLGTNSSISVPVIVYFRILLL